MGDFPGEYEDRFQASTYANDAAVGVYINVDDADAVWVPEQLFWRLVFVARAYALHMLPLLGQHEVTLNGLQIENLLREVAFVADVFPCDPLVAEQAGLCTVTCGMS